MFQTRCLVRMGSPGEASRESAALVHQSLMSIGAMALKEYVDKHSTKVLNTSGDAAKFDGSSPPMPDADTGISVKLDEVSPGVPTSDTRPEEKGATLPAPKSSGVHPMALLPIDPGSKLGRQLRLSATGAVESSYIFPIAIEDGKCLPRLNEFAQAAGLKTPTFTTMSRNAPSVRDSAVLDDSFQAVADTSCLNLPSEIAQYLTILSR